MKILLFLWSDYFIIRAFLSDAIPLRNVMRNVQSIPTTLCAVLPASRNEWESVTFLIKAHHIVTWYCTF